MQKNTMGCEYFMDIKQFIEEVNNVHWSGFDGPNYYKPNDVPEALISLALAAQESRDGLDYFENIGLNSKAQEGDLLLNAAIANKVKFSIGNDHNGSYYPAVRGALPFIIQIALFGNNAVAINCAINVLIDLYYHCPDCTGSDTDTDPKELQEFLRGAIENTINGNRQKFEQIAKDDARSESLIESLLEIIDPI